MGSAVSDREARESAYEKWADAHLNRVAEAPLTLSRLVFRAGWNAAATSAADSRRTALIAACVAILKNESVLGAHDLTAAAEGPLADYLDGVHAAYSSVALLLDEEI